MKKLAECSVPTLGKVAIARHDHLVAEPEERARDLMEAWFDPNVDLILSMIGGTSTAQIIEHLPLERMAENPVPILGYSDTTSLLAALYQHKVPSIYGPALLPQFAKIGGPHDYTRKALCRVLSTTPVGRVAPCRVRLKKESDWTNSQEVPGLPVPADDRFMVCPGEASGPIFACNLGTLLTLAGTRYLPDLGGHILVVEEDDTESPATMERLFTHLRMSDILSRISALVVGRLPMSVGMTREVMVRSVRRMVRGLGIPVAIGFEVGHVDPFHAIPNGAMAHVCFTSELTELSLSTSLFRSS